MPKTKKEYQAFYEKTQQARQKWRKEHTMIFNARFNYTTDADIIEWLESRDNKVGSIKALIRAEIAREAKR